MGIILDVILAVIILICIIVGAKRGFAKTAIETVGFFLALYVAFTLCTPIATAVADKTVKPAIVSKISTAIPETASSITEDAAQSVWDTLPEYVQKLATKANYTPKNLADTVNGQSYNGSDKIANTIASDVVMPFVYNLAKIICAIILFVILLIVVKLLAKLISGIFKLPVLNGVNKLFGAAFGGVQGVLYASLFCVVISAVISLNYTGFWFFTKDNIEASTLFKWLITFSPFN